MIESDDRETEKRVKEIAHKIKRLRTEAGLSYREAAMLTGVAASTIQKIEAYLTVPSIATLMRLAQGFNKKASYFVDDGTKPEVLSMVRSEDRKKVKIKPSRLSIECLTSNSSDPNMEVTILTMGRGGKSGNKPMTHPGEEVKLCLEGRIAYVVNGKEYVLNPGDCLQFKSTKPHSWRNVGRGACQVLSVCTPPPLLYVMTGNHGYKDGGEVLIGLRRGQEVTNTDNST